MEGELLHQVRQLFVAYQKELDADLCFQSFEKELENPLEKYGKPSGALFAVVLNGKAIACIALTSLEIGICEMKRLYVQPDYRKYGFGEILVQKLLHEARNMGYTKMKLDTLEKLQPAIKLYRKLGFSTTNSYYHNPLPEVVYMEKQL